MFYHNPELRTICRDFDLGGINRSPLNAGILTGKFTVDSTFPEDDFRNREIDFTEKMFAERIKLVEELREVLTQDGRTLVQVALAWIWALDERMVPIPGFKTVKQVAENAGTLEFGPLSADQMQAVAILMEGE
jgi:aryl-alcohol dehydrogenase-like predicted oxidoreductase